MARKDLVSCKGQGRTPSLYSISSSIEGFPVIIITPMCKFLPFSTSYFHLPSPIPFFLFYHPQTLSEPSLSRFHILMLRKVVHSSPISINPQPTNHRHSLLAQETVVPERIPCMYVRDMDFDKRDPDTDERVP